MQNRFLILAFASALVPAVTVAGDLQFDPRIELGGNYNDNYRLAPSGAGKIDVWGPQLDAQFTIRSVGPTTQLTLEPRIHSVYFPDLTNQDTNDQFLTVSLAHEGLKSKENVLASYQREDTVNSELPGAAIGIGSGVDLGTILNRDNGVVTIRNRRELLRMQPSVTYQLSTRYDVELKASYEDATYDNTQMGGQVGYRNYGARAALQFASTLTTVSSFRVFGSRYEPDLALPRAATYGGEVEWRKNVSTSQQYYVRAGVAGTRVNPVGVGPTPSSTAFVGGAGVRWLYERSGLFLDLVRDVVPNAFGTVENRDELHVYFGHKLRPQFEAFVSALGSRETQAGLNTAAGNERKYAVMATGFDWRFSREYSISSRIEHRWQTYGGPQGATNGNSVYLSIVYQPRMPLP